MKPIDTMGITITDSKGSSYTYKVKLTDEQQAMQTADNICYARQREYTGWLSIDRFKLRQIIADAIVEAVKAERERHEA